MNPIPINLVVEDELSEAVALRLLDASSQSYASSVVYGRGGSGYIRTRIRGFNRAAKAIPFLVLTDLDTDECPPSLIDEWLGRTDVQPNLLLRVAVHQVEAWLLAHRTAFADFIGVREGLVPRDVESITDAKRALIDIVRRSRRKAMRQDIVPPTESRRSQGPNYNGRLVDYVLHHWEPRACVGASRSLKRAIERIDAFRPTWLAENSESSPARR